MTDSKPDPSLPAPSLPDPSPPDPSPQARGKGERKHLRTIRGIVVSDKMQSTIVVQVNRKVRHPLYEKFVSKRTRLFVHDASGEAKEGDTVEVCRTRRISKLKNWRLVRLVQKVAR